MAIIVSSSMITFTRHYDVGCDTTDFVSFENQSCLMEFERTMNEVRETHAADSPAAWKLLRSLVSSYCRPALIQFGDRWLDSLPVGMCKELLAWRDVTDLRSIQ